MLKSYRFSALNVALCYAAVTLTVLGLFATPLWYAWHNFIKQGETYLSQAEVQRIKDLFASEGIDALAAAIQAQSNGKLAKPGQIILLTDPSLAKLAGNLPAWPHDISSATGIQASEMEINGQRVMLTALHETLPGGYHILVGRDISRFETLETLFLYGLAGSGALALTIAIIGGLMIRGALLSRATLIHQTASAIVEGDLSRRVPTFHERDELAMLTHTINRMLDQMENLLHSVRSVSNAIAHDLRTPLTELRSRLEELSVTRPSATETFAEIDVAIADVDRVVAIFDVLLRLAEIDSGIRRSGFVKVDVAKVAGEVVEFYYPVAELKGIQFTFQSPGNLFAFGDQVLLAQAIGNLIDNALKYARQNGTVSVEVRQGPSRTVQAIVSDDGPGIPEEEKSKVIERFYRSDASRATPGAGLGLSLATAVARLHGGSLELGDNCPGLRATLTLEPRGTSR